jgi:hypothetical protein
MGNCSTSLTPLGAVLGAAVILWGCAPGNVVLRSNHYRVVVPADWQATEEGGVAVLHVPQAASASSAGRLQLRLHAWVIDRAVDQSVEESLRRLTGQGAPSLHPAGDAVEKSCGDLPRGFRLFGHAQPSAYMRTPSGDYVVVAAAHASDSLIAVVGVVPNRPPVCDNLQAMTTAIQSLFDGLTFVGDPTGPPPTQFRLDSPIPGRPSVEIAPSPLP